MVQLHSKTIHGTSDGPHLLITGGVHGDEFEPMAAIRRLCHLLGSHDLRGRVTLVPVVNEPAFRRGSRCAEDGLDLARTCPGVPDGSVTEQIASELSAFIRTADFYVDLHTGGIAFTIHPFTGYMLHPNKDVQADQRRMARAFGLPVIWGTTPALDGRSLSVARDAGVPAIYAEYGGAGTCDSAGVESYVEGCLNVMGELAMIDRTPPHRQIEFVVEDGRENAGHMQIQNPSPCDGYFDPAVRLGQRISAGQLIGTVTDSLGDNLAPVYSQQDGIVLVLRSFPTVESGDSLGVVLEVDRRPGDIE